MARLPRLCIPGQPHHVLMRGVGGQSVFADDIDRTAFLAQLQEAARANRMAVHGWALMPDHVHLLLTPADAAGFSAGMQGLARHHTQGYNRRHGRRGTLWDGRYRSTVLQAERWLLPALVWLDTHPVRSGVCPVSDLIGKGGHPWVSAAHYLGPAPDRSVVVPAAYWALGNTPFAREAAYRTLLEQGCTQTACEALRQAALKGWALGDAAFVSGLQGETGRRLSPAKPGRPRQRVADSPVLAGKK